MLVKQFKSKELALVVVAENVTSTRDFFKNTQKSHKDQLNPNIIGRVLPTGGIFKQECEVSAKIKLTPVTLVYQGLQEFLVLK